MKYIFLVTTLIVAIGITSQAQSDIYIKVGQANVKKSLVAFPEPSFIGNPGLTPSFSRAGADIYRVVENDLGATGFFQFIAKSSFLEDPSRTAPTPFPGTANGFKFENWKTVGAEFLIRMNYTIAGDKLSVETFVYQIGASKLILSNKYTASLGSVRRIAHKFANDLMNALTGKEGMFLSKIIFSSDRTNGKGKEIYMMDWDGFEVQKITNHRAIALSPTWSPDGKKIVYTAFVSKGRKRIVNPDMFLYELITGRRFLLSYRRGLNSGATFHPNGQSIFLTLSENGNSDIFRIDLEGNVLAKLTNGPYGALNVEPSISPDGSKIAFSSDRAGNPMIWIMNIDGSGLKRITYAGKYNSTPVWSPDGKHLAFMAYQNGAFDIFTVKDDGTEMIRLTDARKPNGKRASNENPSYSPDGRHIVFNSDRTGKLQIYMINADGTNERRLTFDGFNNQQPKWSNNFE